MAWGALLSDDGPQANDTVKFACTTNRLRGESTMMLDWIANRLNMGAAGHAAQYLRQLR